MEGFHQFGGQLTDKAHRVHQQKFAAVGQFDVAGNSVQCGEQPILHIDIRPGQAVEQRGFAGIGVAHQSHHGNGALFPGLAAQGALALQLAELPPQLGDSLPDAAAVDLQLAFAGAPGADAARQAGEHQALADQAAALVFELGQGHLQAAFRRAGPLGKDIQDQRGAVHHLDPANVLQVVQLRPGQFVVHDDDVGLQRLGVQGQLLRLAAAHEGGGVRAGLALKGAAHHLGSGAFRQGGQLVQ